MDVASTPKGRKNVCFQLQSNERFSRSTVTLPRAIEQGLAVDLQDVRRSMDDEELFRQESLCEFLDEATGFLTYEQIRRSTSARPLRAVLAAVDSLLGRAVCLRLRLVSPAPIVLGFLLVPQVSPIVGLVIGEFLVMLRQRVED